MIHFLKDVFILHYFLYSLKPEFQSFCQNAMTHCVICCQMASETCSMWGQKILISIRDTAEPTEWLESVLVTNTHKTRRYCGEKKAN